MTRTHDKDSFEYRVRFAASHISSGRQSTRAFDNCFEMYDGDVVVTALIRRVDANPETKLALNLFKYIGEERARECADKLSDIPTPELKRASADICEKRRVAFAEFMARQNQLNAQRTTGLNQ